jgi:hypothetical protein
MRSASSLRWVIAAIVVSGAVCPRPTLTQTPARFYWKTLSGDDGAGWLRAVFRSSIAQPWAPNGFGDPMFEFVLNVIGPRAQKNIPDSLRYEPGFSVGLAAWVRRSYGSSDRGCRAGARRWSSCPPCGVRRQRRLRGADARDRSHVPVRRARHARLHRALLGSFDTSWYTGGQTTISGVTGES